MAKVILEIFEGENAQHAEFVDVERLVIGRIQSAEIRVDHPGMANVHALLEIDHTKRVIKIIDVSGLDKGTIVNSNKVSEFVLSRPDRVQTGPIIFSIYFEPTEKVKPPKMVTIQAPAAKPPVEAPSGEPAKAPAPPPPPPVKPAEKPRVAVPPPPPPPAKEAPKEKPKAPPPPPTAQVPPPPSKPAMQVRADEGTVVTISMPIERTTTPGEVVEITQMIGSDILEVLTFPIGKVVTIGETLEADFTLPIEELSKAGALPFVENREEAMILHVDPDRMQGSIRHSGKLYSLKKAQQEGVLKPGGAFGTTAQLGSQDFAKIIIGSVTFFILRVPKPPKPKAASFIDFDPVFNRVMAVVSFFWVVFMLVVGFTPVEKDIVAERAADKVFQRILIRKDIKIPPRIEQRFNIKEPPPTAPVAKMPSPPKPGGGDEGVGARAAGTEGKRGRTDLPPEKKGVQAKKRQTRKIVSPLQQGLLGALTTTGVGAKLSTLVSKGGTLDKTLEGAGGTRLESGGGVGGKGLRGTGLGGGGGAAHIAGLGTKGRGGGKEGYGEGAVLGKGVSGVLGIGDEVYIEGQLTKEEIRRVVLAHQNELIGCYQLQLSRYPGLRGGISLRWVIMQNGSVSSTSVRSSSWKDSSGTISPPGINTCMLAKIQTWKFPEPRGGGIVTVNEYPFNFTPAQ